MKIAVFDKYTYPITPSRIKRTFVTYKVATENYFTSVNTSDGLTIKVANNDYPLRCK